MSAPALRDPRRSRRDERLADEAPRAPSELQRPHGVPRELDITPLIQRPVSSKSLTNSGATKCLHKGARRSRPSHAGTCDIVHRVDPRSDSGLSQVKKDESLSAVTRSPRDKSSLALGQLDQVRRNAAVLINKENERLTPPLGTRIFGTVASRAYVRALHELIHPLARMVR